jgi:hypothetical protein
LMLPEEPGPKVCASAGSDTPRNAEARVEAAISHNFGSVATLGMKATGCDNRMN